MQEVVSSCRKRKSKDSRAGPIAPTKAAKKVKTPTKRTTRRTAAEQAAYESTMASLDRIIGKNSEDALRELEEEEEDDVRPRTRGRNAKNK